MKVYIAIGGFGLKDGFLTKESIDYLRENADEVGINEKDENLTAEELSEIIGGYDAVITGWGAPYLPDCKNTESLKLVAHVGGSVGDLVDGGIYDRGIKVVSGNELYAVSVAEGTVAYMLTALRSIPDDINAMRGGLWHADGIRPTEGLLDSTVGIIGKSTISGYLMKMLTAFNCKMKIYSSHAIDGDFLGSVGAVQTDLDEIFETCKIVSLHSALTPRTQGMIRGRHFELMKPGSIFINTARGAVICEDEMIEVLLRRGGEVRCVLDVFTKEPLDQNSPLRSMKNVYLLPHRAGPTVDRRKIVGDRIVREVVNFMKGEKLTLEITKEMSSRMTRQRH